MLVAHAGDPFLVPSIHMKRQLTTACNCSRESDDFWPPLAPTYISADTGTPIHTNKENLVFFI